MIPAIDKRFSHLGGLSDLPKAVHRPSIIAGAPLASKAAAIQLCSSAKIITQAGRPIKYTIHDQSRHLVVAGRTLRSANAKNILLRRKNIPPHNCKNNNMIPPSCSIFKEQSLVMRLVNIASKYLLLISNKKNVFKFYLKLAKY
ncbi:MAG: hypothetical protein WCW27_01350 [Patescibacteria group bacterium]|jgi:hypothetical protein